MKLVSIILGLFTSVVLAQVPDDVLLSSSRVTLHKSEFDRIERILKEADFRRATFEEVSNPTRHFEHYEEWIYFIQPIYGDSKNEVLVGFDREGIFRLFAAQALSPMCDCPGDEIYPKKAEKMDKAIERIYKEKEANQSAHTTPASAPR